MKWHLPKLSRNEKIALLVGAVGFAWTLKVVETGAIDAIHKPSAEDQKPYDIPGHTEEGDLALMWRRLKGWPTASGKGDKKACWPGGDAVWLDRKPQVTGAGPRNGVTVTFWVSEAIDSEAFLGRYATDLWYRENLGTGAPGFSGSAQHGDNTRFIERIPPPKPGPPAWRVIMPGQCVFGDVRPLDDDGTVGKFLVDLPAQARVDISDSPDGEGKWVPLKKRLTFEGREATHVPRGPVWDNSYYYRTDAAGRYEVVIRRTDPRNAQQPEHGRWTRFSLIVTWGEGGGMYACGSPQISSNCFGEKNDE